MMFSGYNEPRKPPLNLGDVLDRRGALIKESTLLYNLTLLLPIECNYTKGVGHNMAGIDLLVENHFCAGKENLKILRSIE